MEGQKWTSYCPDQDACVLKETKDILGINSGDCSNDNMASDFSNPQFHAIMMFICIMLGLRKQL